MSKFNLASKSQKKNNLDDKHINVQLEDERTGEDQFQITEVQLKKDRVENEPVILEKLLEGKRLGAAEKTTEGNLNSSKSELDIKYRNSKAYEGNINKLEEKRLSGKKMEDEKYEVASETPKDGRWWDNLLTAKADGKTVTSARRPKSEMIDAPMQEPETEFTAPKWGEAAGMVGEDEGLAPDVADKMDVIDPTQENAYIPEPSFTPMSEDIDQVQFTNTKEKPFDFAGMKGLYLAYEFGDSVADENAIKQQAYDTALKSHDYLEETDLSPDSFNVKDGWVSARLVGEQYLQPQESSSSVFTLGNVEEAEVGSDKLFIGTVNVNPDVIKDMDEDTLSRDLIDFLESQPELSNEKVTIQPDALDLSKLMDGEVSFVGTKPMASIEEQDAMPAKMGLPRKNPAMAPMASTDFPITVLSQSEVVKKN